MRYTIACFICLVCISCNTTKYYVVRHAEKQTAATMMTDVPLSKQGMQRADALGGLLQNKKITHIFSTPTRRTISTAQPLSMATGVSIETYQTVDSSFIKGLKSLQGAVLIVGHSNTVDDVVNGLAGKQLLQDLPETDYGDLFLIIKKGKRYRLSKSRVGL